MEPILRSSACRASGDKEPPGPKSNVEPLGTKKPVCENSKVISFIKLFFSAEYNMKMVVIDALSQGAKEGDQARNKTVSAS